jgi:hypothetical protein
VKVSRRRTENASETKLLPVLSVSECRRAAHAFPRRCIQAKILCGPNSLFFPAVREGADLVHELNSPRRSCMDSIPTRRATKGGRGNLRTRVSCGVRSPSRMCPPLTPRHATKSRAPVISCYVFENAAVCLEIRGDNRRFFSAHSPRAGPTLSEENALRSRLVTPLESAARSGGPNPGTSAGRKSPVLKG